VFRILVGTAIRAVMTRGPAAASTPVVCGRVKDKNKRSPETG
jgi:hypothetical protein